MRKVTSGDITDIARGAAILGAGGGGDPYIGSLMAQQAIDRSGPVELITVDEVPPEAVVVLIGGLGAPTVGVEKILSGREPGLAIATISELIGRPVTHLGCVEAGGVNSTIPFVAAAEARLPVIDCDGMGRAFPEVQMMIPALAGIQNSQIVMTDEKGNCVVIRAINEGWGERFARMTAVVMGCHAMTAQYVMRGDEIAASMVHGTLSLCQHLGASVAQARSSHRDPVSAAAAVMEGHVVFGGKVEDVERVTAAGFARGHASISGIDDFYGSTLRLEFQNEHLVASVDGDVVATVPDLICVLDTDTGEPITTESLRFSQRVRVIVAPCDDRWRTPEGLRLVGPRYFGYDIDYVPVVRRRPGLPA